MPDAPSKTIPEFVARWHCPHTGADEVMKSGMGRDLDHLIFYAMQEAVEMYREYIDKHGYEPKIAQGKAVMEISEGLSVRE